VAAIDGDHAPGDIARRIGDEQQERAIEIARLPEAVLRDPLDDGLAFLAREELAVQVGFDVCVPDGIDADAVARPLERERPGQLKQTALDAAYAATLPATRRPGIDATLTIVPGAR
jgi:hypothetical protein